MGTIHTGTQSGDRKRPQHWVIILWLVLLLLAVFSATGDATTAEGGAADGIVVSTTPLCSFPDQSGLAAQAVPTEAGHLAHEDWAANDAAQADIIAINGALDTLARAPASSDTPEDLPMTWAMTSGIIGTTLDNVSQSLVVAIDPNLVDANVVKRLLLPVAGQIQIEIVPGCHSVAELAAAHDVIEAREWHPDARRASYGYYYDVAEAAFVFTFSKDDANAAAALEKALTDFVVVSIGAPSRLGRLDDGQPHYGGAGIGTQNNNFCTSGFTAAKSGAKGSVTAAHCYASNGLNVWSGPMYYGVTADRQPFPTYDMIRIAPNGQSFTNKIHVDPCCPSVRTVTAKGDTSVNEFVCLSGMTTRAVCGVKVVSMSGTFCDPGCTPNLGYGEKPGYVIAQGGDSGGPVYNRFSTSNAAIRGMIIARDNPWNVYFHKISRIEDRLGVTVSTS